MAFSWNKNLETGNTMIDQQHRQLIDAINNLLQACSSGKGRAEIEKTVKFLYGYTAKHFGDEDKLQVQYHYPDYANHKRYHEEFKKAVKELGIQLQKEGPTVTLVGKVNTSVGGWLLNHIQREDVKVAAHIKAQQK